jgi:hypothetical protein
MEPCQDCPQGRVQTITTKPRGRGASVGAPVRVVSPVERAVALGEQLPEALVGLVPRFQSLPLRDGRLPSPVMEPVPVSLGREKSRVSMVREGYRLWFGKCNDFNLHGVFSRDT